MRKFVPVDSAKDEIKKLTKYVDLAEAYEVNTLEQMMIKEYAYAGSIA